jgi:hypothetical protein
MKSKNKLKNALFAAILALSFTSAAAQAQMCVPPYETIVVLDETRFGVPTVWDAIYGQHEKMMQFFAGIPVKGGTILTVGRSIDKTTFKPSEIVLTEINRRGRVLRQGAAVPKDSEIPVKIVENKDGFIVASNTGGDRVRRYARLAWYDSTLKYRRDKMFKDATYDYDIVGLIKAVDGAGFIAVIHATNHAQEKDQHGLLFRVSPDGETVWKRAYRPGIPNQIYGLTQTEDKGYIAAGRLELEDGRMAGWALKLSADGTINWQRTFPRGNFAVFKSAAQAATPYPDGHGYILLGDIKPTDSDFDAGWVLEINAMGDALWQRYFRRKDTAFNAVGMSTEKDGRINVVMNGTVAEDGSGRRSHVRVLALSPRGEVMMDEPYIEGIKATAVDYAVGWDGERVVTASIESDAKVETPEGEKSPAPNAPPKKKEPPVYEGWVFVGTALDAYNDPCIARQTGQK